MVANRKLSLGTPPRCGIAHRIEMRGNSVPPIKSTA